MTVDILDIGSGNTESIKNWIKKADVPVKIITKATDIQSELLVLPGVGSAGPYMEGLRKKGIDKAIIDHLDKGNRVFGICLGFQLMGNFTEEDGGVEGLGLLNGRVEKLNKSGFHNAWEAFNFKKNSMESALFNSKLKQTRKQNIKGRVFFNHEYGFVSNDSKAYNQIISKKYNRYSSIMIKGNVMGVQFHPEKSQQTGLELLSMVL